jgi:hypothetical protein
MLKALGSIPSTACIHTYIDIQINKYYVVQAGLELMILLP